jgi:hypothetical protein
MEPPALASAEERAAIREYCTSQVELAELATVLKKSTEEQLKVISNKRDAVIEHLKLAGVAYTQVDDKFLRVVQRPTTRPISAAVVEKAIDALTEDQIRVHLFDAKGKPVERPSALLKAVVAAVRMHRTTHHDAIGVTSAPPLKKFDPQPVSETAVQDAKAFLAAREAVSQERARVAELKRAALKRKQDAAPIAASFVSRTHSPDAPLSVSVDYDDDKPSDKFSMRVMTVKPRRIIMSAKSFADAVQTALQAVDITSSAWKSLLLAALLPMFRTDSSMTRTALRAVRRKEGDDDTTIDSSMLDYETESEPEEDDAC